MMLCQSPVATSSPASASWSSSLGFFFRLIFEAAQFSRQKNTLKNNQTIHQLCEIILFFCICFNILHFTEHRHVSQPFQVQFTTCVHKS